MITPCAVYVHQEIEAKAGAGNEHPPPNGASQLLAGPGGALLAMLGRLAEWYVSKRRRQTLRFSDNQ